MILTGSSACAHLCECKRKGEKTVGKHAIVILSGMGLEIPQDHLKIILNLYGQITVLLPVLEKPLCILLKAVVPENPMAT